MEVRELEKAKKVKMGDIFSKLETSTEKKNSKPRKRISYALDSKRDLEKWMRLCKWLEVDPNDVRSPSTVKHKLDLLAQAYEKGKLEIKLL